MWPFKRKKKTATTPARTSNYTPDSSGISIEDVVIIAAVASAINDHPEPSQDNSSSCSSDSDYSDSGSYSDGGCSDGGGCSD